jgi:hypothetical protein
MRRLASSSWPAEEYGCLTDWVTSNPRQCRGSSAQGVITDKPPTGRVTSRLKIGSPRQGDKLTEGNAL